MKTALLIMAAGIGSRFGGGIKQLEPVGVCDEIIMDYSIHDAIQAGFDKIIIVIRKEIEDDFKDRIGNRIEKICFEKNIDVFYVFQDINDVPETVPERRTKPWGTGQAVIAAKDIITEPFMVINADDYYGKDAFFKMHDWLCREHKENVYSMVGFILKNTLSKNGSVTRGICKIGEDRKHLTDVIETRNIIKTENGASADGAELDPEWYVSMNMWGLFPGFVDLLEEDFIEFFKNDVAKDPLKSEFILPTIIGDMLRKGECLVEVLETRDSWFGVTYKEDKEEVKDNFRKLIESGVYNKELYSDL